MQQAALADAGRLGHGIQRHGADPLLGGDARGDIDELAADALGLLLATVRF